MIMPFGDPFDEVYHEIIKEALEENNFTVIRADELYGSKPIMEDILEGIESAEIIVADLTVPKGSFPKSFPVGSS